MHRASCIILLLPLCLGLLGSCLGDETYSTSSAPALAFSADTVSFDTIISGEVAGTRALSVYNRGAQAVRLRRVWLAQGPASCFHANVDGQVVGQADDPAGALAEIGPRDSMRVFLSVKLPELDQDEPQAVEDRLCFQTEGGAEQSVVLTASGQSVVALRGLRLTADTTLCPGRPYQVWDSLVVEQGATLTLAAGTTLLLHPDAEIIVRGTLKSEGTPEQPVTLRGDRLGNMFSGQPYDRIPAQWGGVHIQGESYGNLLRHTDLHSANYGLLLDSGDPTREKLRLEQSVVHNVKGDALHARMAKFTALGSQLSNAGGQCLRLEGGDALLVHCTLAQFYAFAGGRDVCLSFTNQGASGPLPLVRADFLNCIITGYGDDEIMALPGGDETAPLAYLFQNCLLRTPRTESEQLRACQWDEGDSARALNFQPEFDLDHLVFRFSLAPSSKAVGTADADITRQYCPTDRLGRPRMSEGVKPDMGAEQHTF